MGSGHGAYYRLADQRQRAVRPHRHRARLLQPFKMGASLRMPAGDKNGTIAFRGGITVTVHNRKVLALRPLARVQAVPARGVNMLNINCYYKFTMSWWFQFSNPLRHVNSESTTRIVKCED